MYINKVRDEMPSGRPDLDVKINTVFIAAEELIKLMIPDLHEEYNSEKELTLELTPWDDGEYKLCLWVGSSEGTEYEGVCPGEHGVQDCPLFYVESSLTKIIRSIEKDKNHIRLLRSAFSKEVQI